MVTRRPFRQLKMRQWLNLLWAVLALLYLVYAVATVYARGPIGLGGDYLAFHASAAIAASRGFDQVYQVAVQDQFQRPLYEAYASGPLPMNYAVAPVTYLPPFLLPFIALLPLKLIPGYVVWTLLNVIVLVLYLRRFIAALEDYGGRGVFLLVLLSYPAYLTFFSGQVNVWLVVFVGEFFLAYLRGHPFRSGLWLGGLLFKPQTLVLVLPALLYQAGVRVVSLFRQRGREGTGSSLRSPNAPVSAGTVVGRSGTLWARLGRPFRTLAGFTMSALAILVLSVLLAGGDGLLALVELVSRYVGGLPTNCPEVMMNWRALAVNLGALVPAQLSWGVAIVGLALTSLAVLSLWSRPLSPASSRFALVWLGTYAGTCAVTWHSHMHTALPFVIPVLYLVARRRLPRATMIAWAVIPALVFFLTILPLPEIAHNLAGFSTLALNLYLLAWAVKAFWQSQTS